MLAMKDRDHMVRSTPKALSLFARVTELELQSALDAFSAPDPSSRTSEHDGKRIEPVEGGWLILNGEKYRKLLSAEERREYLRIKQAEFRKRKKDLSHQAKCEGATDAINEGFKQYNKE